MAGSLKTGEAFGHPICTCGGFKTHRVLFCPFDCTLLRRFIPIDRNPGWKVAPARNTCKLRVYLAQQEDREKMPNRGNHSRSRRTREGLLTKRSVKWRNIKTDRFSYPAPDKMSGVGFVRASLPERSGRKRVKDLQCVLCVARPPTKPDCCGQTSSQTERL